jgi:hypothetical protein
VELLPAADDSTHLARVNVGAAHATTADERALCEAIPLRRTSRLPFTAQSPTTEERTRLLRAADAEGGRLHFLAWLEVPYVMRTVSAADQEQRGDEAVRGEVRHWINRPPGARDGISAAVLGPTPHGPHAAIRDFTMGELVAGRGSAEFEKGPTLAVLHTPGDTRRDWLVAGQALERVLLCATAQGMAASLLTQPLEVSSLRRLLTHPANRELVPQSLLRLGFGPRGPYSPRRPVADVLTFS